VLPQQALFSTPRHAHFEACARRQWQGAAVSPSPWYTTLTVGDLDPGAPAPARVDWCLIAEYDGRYDRGYDELMHVLDLFPPTDRSVVQATDLRKWAHVRMLSPP
jgi:hypothetical protein